METAGGGDRIFFYWYGRVETITDASNVIFGDVIIRIFAVFVGQSPFLWIWLWTEFNKPKSVCSYCAVLIYSIQAVSLFFKSEMLIERFMESSLQSDLTWPCAVCVFLDVFITVGGKTVVSVNTSAFHEWMNCWEERLMGFSQPHSCPQYDWHLSTVIFFN